MEQEVIMELLIIIPVQDRLIIKDNPLRMVSMDMDRMDMVRMEEQV